VVARLWRREDLYVGAHVGAAPDLLVQLAEIDGYSPSCLRSAGPGPALRRLDPSEYGAGKGSGMNGAHRRDGLFILAGSGVAPAGELPPADIVDVLPTLLALGGVPVPTGLDGQPIVAALAAAVSYAPDTLPAPCEPPRVYDPAEEGDVAARLAALGYLEPRL
jgi:predicted AlkP superfamily phosphohydrolase/phosphomutase